MPRLPSLEANQPPPTHAGGVVYRPRGGDREFLIVTGRRNPGHWVLPKGHIEPGETADRAALREVREETGVTAHVQRCLGDVNLDLGAERPRIRYFLMLAIREERPEETRTIAWLPAEAAAQKLSFPESRNMLAAAVHELRHRL